MSNFVANMFYKAHIRLASQTANFELAAKMIDIAEQVAEGDYKKAFALQKQKFAEFAGERQKSQR